MTGFVEKPADPPGDLANAGVYAFSPAVLDLVEEPLPRDIGFDLLPELVGRANTVDMGGAYFIDIGTPAALARARDEWQDRAAS
jgi:mannose-1-phosphate guanylyltransferase